MFVCGAWCMSNALVPDFVEKTVDNVSKYSVPQCVLGKQFGECASSSNASPMYSDGTTAICKAIARKNAVDSNFACYKQHNIKVKFSEDYVKSLLQKSNGEDYVQSTRSEEDAKQLLKDTKKFANNFFCEEQRIKEDTIDIGNFTENRIYTGTKVGWICSENSDEFVAKRLFEPALSSRVLTLLEEWKRKFDATMDTGTVKAVLERIKSVEVLSGLLAAAVCDEYEQKILNNSACQISNDFISSVYRDLKANFFDSKPSEKYDVVYEIKEKYNISGKSSDDKFNLRNCFDEDTMCVFWDNFQNAFESKKDAIIKNALTGLKLYKVSGVLDARLNAVKEGNIIETIRENDDKFYSSFNSNANIEFDNISVQLTDINVDLSLMLAVNGVHAVYNELLKKDQIQLNELYSSGIINSFKDVNKERDTQNINGESLYASVLASKIMERFLYQACYAQYAYSQTPKEFLKMVCDSFFACNFGLKLSNSNFMDIDRLKEVLHTDDDKNVIDQVKEYHELCRGLEQKKIEAAKPETIQKQAKEEKLANCMRNISLETINKVLSHKTGNNSFNLSTEIDEKLGYKKRIVGDPIYDSKGNKIGSTGSLFAQFIKCNSDTVLLTVDRTAIEKYNLIDDKYRTKRSYSDEELTYAFDYCFTNDKGNAAGNAAGKEVFEVIKADVQRVFDGIYSKTKDNEKYLTEEYGDADWNALTKKVIVMKFVPSSYNKENQNHNSLLNAFEKRSSEFPKKVDGKSQPNELVTLQQQITEVSSSVYNLLSLHAKNAKEYSENTYERALAKVDNGISQEKVSEAIKKYNENYAVEDIYLSANSSWFFNQCAEIRDILDQIAAQGKSAFSGEEYAIYDDSDYRGVEDRIRKLASQWQNLKWLSAHQAVKKNGLAGVELSNLTTTGIGSVLETLLDVPVFSSTKDWVSNSGTKLPEKIDSATSEFICNILSRMHQDICSFFVSRVAATFLCNIFESNKDYSSLTESNAKTPSLILKSFSSSMVDFIADFYKIKECIDSSTGRNIANSSDLLIYAKDCLLSSTTCNKGVIAQVPDDLNKLTDAWLDCNGKKLNEAYCYSKDNGEFITPMADIKTINFSLQNGVDNVDNAVLNFDARNKDGMHPLSFVALVDFVRGKINFDQRMILLDSICIPVEGLFEKFQRVTKSGLLGEVPVELTSVRNVLDGGDLGSVINYSSIQNDLRKSHSVFWAENENPFFVPENDRAKYGYGVGSTVTVTPPLLYSLKSDSIGDAKAWSLNDLIKKDIFSPQALQILLFLLYKSEDLACVNRVNKSVFYYLSHRERALIADCNGQLIEEDLKPLTSKSVYVYKSPYFSPIFSKSEEWDRNSSNTTYDIYGEYSPFYFNIGDIGSRSIFGMLNTVMHQKSSYDIDGHQQKLGCLGNIIKNVDFYSGDTKINGDSVERLAKRYTNGLFNLPVSKCASLDSVIFNICSLIDDTNQLSISNFFDCDLTHFSDILMFVGSVNLLGHKGGRFSNCQLEIMQGTYTPGFTSPKYRDSCSLNNGKLSSLHDINSYKGFLLPAIGMLLTDKTSSFMAEKNYRNYNDMMSTNKQYLKDILKDVDNGKNEKDVFHKCFAYGLFANRFRWEHGMYRAAQSLDKINVLSSKWNVRYTINVQEKLNKLNEIIKKQEDQEGELFLYLADNEPMHIYKIAEIMCNVANQVKPTGIAISKNGKNFTYTTMLSYENSLIQASDKGTEHGFFYISPQIHQYITQIVVDIYATKNTGDAQKEQAEWKNIDNDEKIHMYAGVLFSLFAGEWKFRLGKYLED